MAKLSKVGTKILWRMERTQKIEDGEQSVRYALRSDGTLLHKLVIVRPDYRHDYGWKVVAKKARSDAKELLLAKGYIFQANA